MNFIPIDVMCNILSTHAPLRRNLHSVSSQTEADPLPPLPTPPCVAPNHPRGLYYKGLAAHLTLQRRRGAGRETGTSAPLSFHMVEHRAHHTGTHTHAGLSDCAAEPLQLCATTDRR